MNPVRITKELECKDRFDVIVAGGGVSGAAAAVSAARLGKRVLLIEKQINLGGLATTGLINLFTPMCNGRGKKIITGMAEEFLNRAIEYGFDTLPEEWCNGEPGKETGSRYTSKFSAPIFMLVLTELLHSTGVEIMFDSLVTDVVSSDGHIKGVVIENKSGSSYYAGSIFVDATGDGEIMTRAGVPCVQGYNYDTYICFGADLESVRHTQDKSDFRWLTKWYTGNCADLWGRNHPEGKPYWLGTNAEDVNQYLLDNQLLVLEKIKKDSRKERDILLVPGMVQFRTTRHIDGDYTLTEDDIFKHQKTSIGTICDFSKRDLLYEVPFGTLVRTGFDNLITAGRSVSADGFAWDVVRLIPPAILTGQAAGVAAARCLEEKAPIFAVNITLLQAELERQGVMIHYDDSLIPAGTGTGVAEEVDIGHI